MQATEQMIQAAVQKAKELGVLPRKISPEDIATNNEIMAEILQAAFNADSAGRKSSPRGEREDE